MNAWDRYLEKVHELESDIRETEYLIALYSELSEDLDEHEALEELREKLELLTIGFKAGLEFMKGGN